MILRKITPKDKDQVCKLIKEGRIFMNQMCSYEINKTGYNRSSLEGAFKEYMGPKNFFYGIEEKDKIVAFLYGYIKKYRIYDTGYIDFIVVSSKHQCKGYATLLRDEFYRWLKNKKINYCSLHVLYKNQKPINIYKKWGYGIAALVMTKKLE